MRNFSQYCKILGVEPGDSAEQVRHSFRNRIKKCHPDSAGDQGSQKSAQFLIEAYESFKNGVPKLDKLTSSKGKQSIQRGRRANTSTFEKGYYSAKRMFDAIFADVDPHQKLRDFFFDFETELYPEDEHVSVWEKTSTRGRRPVEDSIFKEPYARQKKPHLETSGSQSLDRAEVILRVTVENFEKSSYRFTRSWAREFIGDLVQVQVLYRDVCQSDPPLAYQALKRVRQITELINEIRNHLL